MAELTVGIDTILSDFWGDLDEADLLKRALDCYSATIGSRFSYALDSQNCDYEHVCLDDRQILEFLEVKEGLLEGARRRADNLPKKLLSMDATVGFGFQFLASVRCTAEKIEADISVLEEHVDLINKLIWSRDAAAASFAELESCMRNCHKRMVPLGREFEVSLKSCENIIANVQSITAAVNSAEVFTTYRK